MQKKIFKAAIYVRLSKEDGDVADAKKAESNSISNQKSLILNFLKDKKDIEVVSVREDDGYSGTNFNRPAFQLMMNDVQEGKVDCVIVKDLSRFGREYIDSGRYIEKVFPALGVRFIAVNDGIDSIRDDQLGEIIVPFKNLINDAYARDISIKIRSSLEAKRQNGEYVGNYCAYGYQKDEKKRNHIIPDEYAGHVVQDIFHWVIQGMSLDAVSVKLNEAGILSPMEYRRSRGEKYYTSFRKNEVSGWTPTAVRRIVSNPVYTGTLVQGKVTTPNHKIKTHIDKAPEKWAVVKNCHEPLVTEREYETVQKLLQIDMRTAPGQDGVYIMSGIAVCADCGALMSRKVSEAGGKKYCYYVCSNNKKHKRCSPHRIREDKLESMVFETLKEISALVVDADEMLRAADNNRNLDIEYKKYLERIQANETEGMHYNKMLISLYEDYRDGIVDKQDFLMFKESFEEKRKMAEQAVARLKREIEKDKKPDSTWIEEYRKLKTIPFLTRNVLVNLVSQVKVYEKGDIEIVLDDNDIYEKLNVVSAPALSQGIIAQKPDLNGTQVCGANSDTIDDENQATGEKVV